MWYHLKIKQYSISNIHKNYFSYFKLIFLIKPTNHIKKMHKNNFLYHSNYNTLFNLEILPQICFKFTLLSQKSPKTATHKP